MLPENIMCARHKNINKLKNKSNLNNITMNENGKQIEKKNVLLAVCNSFEILSIIKSNVTI